MKSELELFLDLYKQAKTYKDKIDFLLSHLNKVDQEIYNRRLNDLLIHESPKRGPEAIIRKEGILNMVVTERLIEDQIINSIGGRPSDYCANKYYRLIRTAINLDDSYNDKPGHDIDFHKVTGHEMLLIGISIN